jgi:hypothetical protein
MGAGMGHASTKNPDRAPPASGGGRADSWAPAWLRLTCAFVGVAYILSIWLGAIGTGLPELALPRPLLFFTQVAELFPHAALDSIEWRVRGWRCDLARFDEIDVRPFFPIREDDKESRFDRAMFFHHRQRLVLEALDRYLTDVQNRTHPADRIGGVMLMSLRIPIPPMGEPGSRRRWMPLSEYPAEVERRYWYTTSQAGREHRCEERP